jgi:hypothetical protein
VISPGNDKIVIPGCVEIFTREGIVHVVYDDGAEVGRELKREMHEAYLKITGGEKMPFLFANKGAFWIAKDARDYARKIEPLQPFKAVAYWAPDLAVRLMAEFYGKFYKPEIPYKVFYTEEESREWLKQFQDQSD